MNRLTNTLALHVLLACAALAPAQAQGTEGGSTPQEQAQFLAGIPLPRRSLLAPLQQSAQYRAHQKELQAQWTFCRQVRYEAMQRWAAEHLARYPATRGVLRYLFGGPDFLNAYAFFPDTRVMVLGGLEPLGEVPPPEALSPAALAPALQALDEALHTSLFTGYFITSEMKPRLAQGAFRGVLPVLYTELALTGNILDAVSMERPFGSPGLRITYHRPGGPAQTLWYFQADLSNGKTCRNFLSWLGELGPGVSYLKAASYLLPLDAFSETRNFLIRTSELILQDDSGLPYRAFQPGLWRISLYGVYTDPLPIFRLRREPALAEAYESPLRVGSLPFGAGYHVDPSDANLLLAIRAGEAVGQPVTATGIPAAVPAFATPTPARRPSKIRIRKALPVPIRKALPVITTATTPNPVPVATATPAMTPAAVPSPVVAAPTPPPPPLSPSPSEPPAAPRPPTSSPSPDAMTAAREHPAIPSTSPPPSATPELPQDEPPAVESMTAEPAPVVAPSEQPQPAAESPLPAATVPLTGEGKPVD